MATNAFQKMYRQLSKKMMGTVVRPQILGDRELVTSALSDEDQRNTPICYVIQDNAMSNKVLIDNETESNQLPSAFTPLVLQDHYQEDDCFLVLEPSKNNSSDYYPDKIIRMVEYLLKHPEEDVLLIPTTILWGRAPEHEDRWYKALLADAWTKPTGLKQALNISLYNRENYIEFHRPVSLQSLVQTAVVVAPHHAAAHYVVKEFEQLFKDYKEAILGPDLSDRRNVIHQLMVSENVKAAVLQESIGNQIKVSEAENRARGYLEEIVSDFSYSTLRFAQLALSKLWTQLYDGIEVHHFETVRELAKDYQIVYTPCHRSHIDYLLMSYLIYDRGLMVPHIAAGINLNMPVVGQILRGGGAYFIRRSFKGNALYTAVFKEYMHSLLSRNTPLEYFIEGGRSRTGLLLQPKKGMLAMTIQSHLRGNSKPIAFIPTYFGYEKLLEGSSYIKELGGEKKQAESLFGLLKSIQKIEKVFGTVHVSLGEPVFLEHILKRNQAPEKLSIQEEVPESVKQTVDDVAQNILENINKAVVINPVSLISLVLLNAPTYALSEREVLLRLQQLRNLLQFHRYDARMSITALSNSQIIQYVMDLKQIEWMEHDHERWVKVSDTQIGLLKYFSNNILHTFILPALIAHILKVRFEQHDGCITRAQINTEVKLVYPDLQRHYFLKWNDQDLMNEINEILNFLVSEKVIQIKEAEFHVSSEDQKIRFLASLAHLYDVNVLEKDSH
ncbi:glycerol-3-phosphate 1-O-acyltransferase PlsB [Acinetobacter sp. 187]|uniref:glycerol-3-phosphate 1-O-acyltransferase PlsB n=1 Tax=Acinetobacter lanii TaxID=2715163 RepID=UPI001408CB5D|nr:glycerol-3-phosphate 1-O-acyltransferase PlsB [Acinetobacter lanii]NHC02646.1 glycerol-3-phosphate 1-O-acyltransferase PlsB [Acinetobacter lanii]